MADHPYRDVQILLVVFESFVIVTLAAVNIPDIIVRHGHVQVVVALHGYEHLLSFPVVKKRLFEISQIFLYHANIQMRRGHVRVIVAVNGYEHLFAFLMLNKRLFVFA